MRRVFVFGCVVLLAVAPAFAREPDVTTIPDGVARSEGPSGPTGVVPCDILIRYDDGTDDSPNVGLTLGGPGDGNQRLGILAEAPVAAPGSCWEVQSAGFFAEFWIVPGNVNITTTSATPPLRSTSEAVFVNAAGNWEVAFATPIAVRSLEPFQVILCPDDDAFGVSGEDLSAPDDRSYVNGDACSLVNEVNNQDLMIWACVTATTDCPPPIPPIQEIPTLGRKGLVALGLLLAALGAGWALRRRRAEA